jgi:Tol biopolymer transport system component
MTPERYRRINELADAALELPARQRAAFLADACSGDPELRAEVERLVEAQASDQEFLAVPAVERLAAVFAETGQNALAGTRFGRYEVIARLGAGGHGEVWLAEDRQLSRQVAIKLLSPEYASQPDHVARLYAEARISSSLNHPNIVTIYDTGHAEGADFIAQEYVQGETLRQRLGGGPLEPRTALNVLLQIASALEAAHAAGVVHRDIKPENVMIRADGLVKVLDFGLARSVRETARDTRTSGASVVMGTAKYMSPEQVRGAPTDSRSDVFSFGVVLYEVLSGLPPFGGTTFTEILNAILESEPAPLSMHVPGLPSPVERILSRCLAKDPDRRYQTGAELRQALLRVSGGMDSAAFRSRRRWVIALATAAGIVAGFGIYRGLAPARSAPFDTMKVSLLATSGLATDAAISPDGTIVAYLLEDAKGQSIWVRPLGGGGDRQILAAAPGNRHNLLFSPDGGYLYYVQGTASWTGTLYRVPRSGGTPAVVLEQITGRFAFAPDGRLAFMRLDMERWSESLIVANFDGSGERVVATRRRPQYYSQKGLAWSPDGRSIVCLAGNARFYGPGAFYLVEIGVDRGTERPLTGGIWAWAGPGLWSSDGRSLLVGAGEHAEDSLQVWRVSYPSGQVQRITNDLGDYIGLTRTADSKELLALRRERRADLWLLPAAYQGRAIQIPSADLHNLISAIRAPDGRIIFSALAGNSRNIWAMDTEGGNRRQLTSGESDQGEIAISPDGRYIVYYSEGRIWRVNSDGSGLRQLTRGPLDVHPAVSPDGKWVVYASFAGWSPGIGGRPMLWKIPIDGGVAIRLTEDNTSVPDVSPDGRYVACASFQYDLPNQPPGIAIYPFQGGTAMKAFRRLPGADDGVHWTADGKALEYVVTAGGVGNVWRQAVSGGPPVPLSAFHTDRILFSSMSPDRKTLVLARGQETNDLVLLTGIP